MTRVKRQIEKTEIDGGINGQMIEWTNRQTNQMMTDKLTERWVDGSSDR